MEDRNTDNSSKSGKNKKYLLIGIVVILIAIIGVASYFLYQNYRMQEMDKLMLESNTVFTPQLNAKITEANNIANSTSPDYNKVGTLLDEAILLQTKIISNVEKAYQYADGPYKELLALSLTRDRLDLNILNSWKSRIEYIKQGNSAQALQLLSQEQDLATESTKAHNEYVNFKSTHPDVKEHTVKYWNSTAV